MPPPRFILHPSGLWTEPFHNFNKNTLDSGRKLFIQERNSSGRSINSFWQTPQLTFHFHINDFFFTVITTASLSIRVLLPRAFSFKEKRYNKCTCIHASVLMWIVFINIWRILYYYLRCGWDNKQLVYTIRCKRDRVYVNVLFVNFSLSSCVMFHSVGCKLLNLWPFL